MTYRSAFFAWGMALGGLLFGSCDAKVAAHGHSTHAQAAHAAAGAVQRAARILSVSYSPELEKEVACTVRIGATERTIKAGRRIDVSVRIPFIPLASYVVVHAGAIARKEHYVPAGALPVTINRSATWYLWACENGVYATYKPAANEMSIPAAVPHKITAAASASMQAFQLAITSPQRVELIQCA